MSQDSWCLRAGELSRCSWSDALRGPFRRACGSLAVGLPLTFAAALPADAQPAAAVELRIAAQPLAQALNELARQARLQVLVAPDLVAGKTAPALAGRMTAREAVDRLLLGSGLAAGIDDKGTVSVRRVTMGSAASTAPAAREPGTSAPPGSEVVLPPVRVQGSKESLPGALPEAFAGGQVAKGARLGMLGNVDVMTTPFSIKAYTAELIRDQGARSVDDLVANDPSIRVSLSPGFVLDQSSIRGFTVGVGAYRIDGMPGLLSYSRVPVQNYERIEILKGPATGVYGAGAGSFSVGGVVNLVPKRAGATPTNSITLSAGDESMFGTHLDVGRRFGTDQAFGIRVNVVAEKGTLSNTTRRENTAPQVGLDYAGERFRATLDAGTVDYRNERPGVNHSLQAGQPVPAAPNPRRAAQPDWAVQAIDGWFGLAGVAFDLRPELTVYAKYGLFEEKSDKSFLASIGPLRGDGTFAVTGASYNTWSTDNKVADLGLRAQFATGPVKHQLTLSALRYQTVYAVPSTGQGTPPAAPFVPVQGTIYADYPLANPFTAGAPLVGAYTGTPLLQRSVGFADSVSLLGDKLNLVLGLRRQQLEQGAYSGTRNSPTVAASYQLGGGFTVYGNYAEALLQGAQAPTGTNNVGENLPPYVGKQNEIGLKWNAGSHGVTLAYFDIKQASAFTDPADNVFKAAGEQRNRGLELETFGELGKGLRLLGGVAYIDAQQTKTRLGATDGKRALGVARANLNLGTEWDVAALPGLTLTGRVIHTGSAYVDLGNTQALPAWTRVDIGARYALKLDGKALTLRAGVNNLADKAYWQSGGRSIFVVAEPRTWRLSATVDF